MASNCALFLPDSRGRETQKEAPSKLDGTDDTNMAKRTVMSTISGCKGAYLPSVHEMELTLTFGDTTETEIGEQDYDRVSLIIVTAGENDLVQVVFN